MSLNRSILATALTGASGAGGTLIYHHAIPWTWEEVLVKEGCYFLNADDEYKAVWSEHKTTLISKISGLESTKQTFTKESIQKWCESQLKGNYEKNTTSYTNISNLCTNKGITTVKAKLILSGYDEFIDDEAKSAKENLYRTVFGIYRYYDKFIEWVKKFQRDPTVKNEVLKEDAVVGTGWLALSSACNIELNKPYKEVTDINHYTHLSWWCKKFKYKTVEELIKSWNPNWTLSDDWKGKGDKWKYTEKVLEIIGQGKNNHETIAKITDSKIGEWCDRNSKRTLEDNDIYIQTYTLVKYVCGKEKPKKKSGSK